MAMASPPPPPLPQQPAPARSFFPQHDELQALAAQMLRSQSTPTPMASPPPPPPPQQAAPAPARSFFPQVDELQTLASQMLRSQSTPNLMASPPPPPPPHPQQPAPARSFPQHDEVQTLAAQMLRSQSNPIPMASPPPPPPQQPAPGFSFYPQEHELVQQYLRPKLHGSPLPSATKHFFHDVDVYAAEPSTLASLYPPGPARASGESENWYFFCPVKAQIAHDGRKPRIVAGGKGTWKADRGKNVIDPVEGCVVGRRERFTYVPKPKEEGNPTEWLMTEFSVDQEEGGAVPGMVLYKIYRSPRFLKNASKPSSSSSASVSARKRKAADDLLVLDNLSPPSPSVLSARKNVVKATSGSSSPVRRQLLFPSPPAEVAPNPPAEVAPNPPAAVAPNPPAEVAPNNLTAEVDEMMAEYLADDKNWEGFNCIANPSSAPWSCSMMTMASNPFCSGPEFLLNSIVAAP